ncbi:multifunctional oxoglutarate decarboxylase/oxoglutarate dehydrogenase thiamine pyrophosphate-binding subunit/dihydrolipoyllysine-residue succinyltransferase subunit [Yimella sp. cx-51]|uniref:multifunctional oxoglutarate decarboxylase/oxoglutarate dehydrogenase thiamine pyrophosphate-binding subunit/dihydrolipoyllysine-residue succinyltransferase subunit n=1 Tax=Yimella sp. cx-51 TaxID=2770551 RepID=UPI00165DC33E|nr:multifunctional oxoglutarate decarboxylase/oxoglutarate dehydrogenase thiamine pyrophosphate-binding subunit/dihydrolipoyllysine-residue succinyltransferase subunit [Yimella sp. cx-51]MBC9956135.1 multifunctional oxoglutarate decarboxylase/oxoglutarate dehydrogenase thiamine pyrophosphate-binding subunit/dihydrolipoyllysine-residue succinyltransferase subunit [Yimella sp. cx-51]QTH37337.1 multifunctional oxoglutarate decarboxylase/oxoglutarate dehydrogenase thiamine pyrophosphate-binding subun
MSQPSDPLASFGPNEWLVDELYEQYLKDKNSVDKAWWSFFADYQPDAQSSSSNGANASDADASAKPATSPNGSADSAQTSSPSAAAADTAEQAAPPADQKSSDAKPAARAESSKSNRTVTLDPKQAEVSNSRPISRDGGVSPVQAPEADDERVALKGVAARIVANMEASLEVPTATSVRSVPAKLLIDNRIVINNHLARSRGGKVSFTHLLGFAIVKALKVVPDMNNALSEDEKGKPVLVRPGHVNFGLAIDLQKPDGSRTLVVPSIKNAEAMDFVQFWTAYEDMVKKARTNSLTVEDYAGTTITLTNPGGIGTVHSVPRLMKGSGAIIGAGALEYPAEWQGASTDTLNKNAVSKVMTLTSTYDHRIIQGATSGEFLRVVNQLLLGEEGFYDEIFQALRIPYEPIRWVRDIDTSHDDDINKVARVHELIHAYRVRGHLMADTDPLEYKQRRHPDLDVTNHGLTLWDLDRSFPTGGFGGEPFLKLRKILGILRDSYCRGIGIEYMHIQDPEQRQWIQSKVEVPYEKATADEQLRILRKLNAAEAFETFLQTKFVGQKRFSLEGGESVIALLDRIMCEAADQGLDEVCIGMPHRGRLNVLANIAGKSYGQIFREFEGTQDPNSVQGSGDVKYHLGTEGEFVSDTGKKTKVYLAANPSHLEAVDPVLEGIARAKQDRINLAGTAFTVLPILLHGDAAFAGQGVVAETLNLSQLRGYRTGGTIHIVINNQVGFTTAPSQSRSSTYSTDVARMVQAPIFHVNGDDPEACVRVAELAYEFRQKFRKDVVIDMVCYRRRGHNEGDDPSMTQPLMYNLIEAKRSVRKLYTEALIGRGDISSDEAEAALRDYQQQLERVFVETKAAKTEQSAAPESAPDASTGTDAEGHGGLERPSAQAADDATVDGRNRSTAISESDLAKIGNTWVNPPEGFTVHPKLAKLMERRADMVQHGGVDWAMGELTAFGSLLMEGIPVRLAGQDSRRGTFVQRHAVLIDKINGNEWTPLRYLTPDQAWFWVYDSLLSEYAAMGFEYGYSVERPDALVLWEAQFGDFVNGAQTILDEFVSSSEQKWAQRSSVVLLLPHGYEGQGPDHSSARIERFLQLFAEDNMTIAYPSTPASYFHLLRRQAYARPRRPLVVFTPKQLLRLKAATSNPAEFTSGVFQPVLRDQHKLDSSKVTRVLLASSRVVYDLEAEREKRGDDTTAIVRVEQLAPIPAKEIAGAVAEYPNAELMWVQDEPKNQGAWSFMALNLPELLAEHGENRPLQVACRAASASPATGSGKRHQIQQAELVAKAFDR